MIFGLAFAGPVATRSMFAATTINGISPYQALMPAMLVGAAIAYTVLDVVAAYTLPWVTDSPDQQDASE